MNEIDCPLSDYVCFDILHVKIAELLDVFEKLVDRVLAQNL
jgi:hypothetical protein